MLVSDEIDGERIYLQSSSNNNHLPHVIAYAVALPFVVGKKVVDLCCGTGYGTRLLSEAAISVIGVDYSKTAITYNESRPLSNVKYAHADVEDFGKDAIDADVITCMQGLEHLEDPKTLIKNNLDKMWIIAVPNDKDETNEFHHHQIDEAMIKDWFGDRSIDLQYFNDAGQFSHAPDIWYTNFFVIYRP